MQNNARENMVDGHWMGEGTDLELSMPFQPQQGFEGEVGLGHYPEDYDNTAIDFGTSPFAYGDLPALIWASTEYNNLGTDYLPTPAAGNQLQQWPFFNPDLGRNSGQQMNYTSSVNNVINPFLGPQFAGNNDVQFNTGYLPRPTAVFDSAPSFSFAESSTGSELGSFDNWDNSAVLPSLCMNTNVRSNMYSSIARNAETSILPWTGGPIDSPSAWDVTSVGASANMYSSLGPNAITSTLPWTGDAVYSNPAWNDNNIGFENGYINPANNGPASLPGPTVTPTPASAPTANAAPAQAGPRLPHRCNFPGCNKRFKRPSDLIRHRKTVHLNMQGHLCPIPGCPRSHGAGYSRADKVTEHLWRKHADLGYTKA